MYFNLLILALVTSSFAHPANETDLAVIRAHYLKASSNQQSAETILNMTAGKSEAIFLAYNGAATCIMAEHRSNPYTKLNLLYKGLERMNSQVQQFPSDIEIRFLRFSVEEHIPSVVPFTSHVNEDRNFLLKNLDSKHPFYKSMKAYLKNSKSLSDSDKQKLP